MVKTSNNCYALYIYLIDDLIRTEYYQSYDEADRNAAEYAELDKDQILNYDIQKIDLS